MKENTDAEAWQAIEAHELFEQRVLPCGGGYLDQTRPYLDAMRFIRVELTKLKAQAPRR